MISIIDIKEFFEENELRYMHIKGVSELADKLTKRMNLNENSRDKCIQSALLHDIGYSKFLNKTNFHSYDGYIYCIENNIDSSVSKAVLLHSGSIVEMMLRKLNLDELFCEVLRSLSSDERLILDIVTFCDTHTDSYGNQITLEERIKSINKRYPNDIIIKNHISANLQYYFCLDKIYGKYLR